MSLWGTKDSVYADGTIAVNFSTLKVVGTGTTFNTAGLIKAGDIITCGAGQTYGEAVITAVDSGTQLSILNTDNFASGVTTVIAGAAYNITQKPKSTLKDTFDKYNTITKKLNHESTENNKIQRKRLR